MLVLSRKPMERIRIGSDIVVTVVRISPGAVRLGIDAPRHLSITREDVEIVWTIPEAAEADSQLAVQELVDV